MVDDIVVAAVDAPTIRAGLEPSHHALGRAVHRDRGDREAVRVLSEAIEVHTRREVRTGLGDRTAIRAAGRYLRAYRLPSEMRERAGRGETLAPAEDPHRWE